MPREKGGSLMHNVLAQWNQAAEKYCAFEQTSRYAQFCREFVCAHLPQQGGQTILDAGCGNGAYTHLLRQNGNTVIGCDGAEAMLALARKSYAQYPFDKVDLLEPLPYASQQFDVVVCNLVLMDIDPIDTTLAEFQRVLKPGGIFFFSIVHPAFYQGTWERDAKSAVLCKKVPGYLTPTAILQNEWGETMHYHRPVSFYLNQAAAAGFCLNSMFEPRVYEESKNPDIPLYLFCKFQKLSNTAIIKKEAPYAQPQQSVPGHRPHRVDK